MQQPHHIDDFSVSDLRHTLGEAFRVVCDRRWRFILPFLGVSTLALIASLWLPRQWSVSTIIRREHDPMLASMVGKTWTEPYADIRTRMASELSDMETIQTILRGMKLPEHGEYYSDGQLSPASATAESAMAAEVAAGLVIKNVETSATRDVVSIRLTMGDSAHVADILRAIRDNYISRAQRRTTEILRGAETFLQGETTRCRGEAGSLQKQLFELEATYPGINPDAVDPTQAAETSLVVEGVQLARKLDEVRDDLARLDSGNEQAIVASDVAAVASGAARPNPRYTSLMQDIEKIQRDIIEGRTMKMMTEQHPTIQRLVASLEAKQSELDRTPATEAEAAGLQLTPTERLTSRKAELLASRASLEKKIAANREERGRIEQSRTGMLQARDSYLKIKAKLARANEELAGWEQNMGPLKHVLTLEDSNRGIHFATVRDVESVVRPASPDGRVVIGLCFAIGAAVGVVVVLVTELLDRSFRTAQGLSSSLGIPLIESIDEILTAAAIRKRLIRRVVILPVTAAVLTLTTFAAGAMAYLSLQQPADYETVKHSPHLIFSALWNS
ncbi:MAG TPA: hypothetical protein VMV81_10315 [Phycisphaerae bacterium]|nr:hypothetical protein [Phycisphaerae bacterium]